MSEIPEFFSRKLSRYHLTIFAKNVESSDGGIVIPYAELEDMIFGQKNDSLYKNDREFT